MPGAAGTSALTLCSSCFCGEQWELWLRGRWAERAPAGRRPAASCLPPRAWPASGPRPPAALWPVWWSWSLRGSEEREGELHPSSAQQLEAKQDWAADEGERSPSAAHSSIYSKMSVWSVEQFKGLLRPGTFYSLMLVFYYQAHERSLSSGWKHTHTHTPHILHQQSTIIIVIYQWALTNSTQDSENARILRAAAWQREIVVVPSLKHWPEPVNISTGRTVPSRPLVHDPNRADISF